jgi:hypothetical protein
MNEQFIFEAEPFEADSEFDEYEEEVDSEFGAFDTELPTLEWEEEVNRRSLDYIRWVQQSLNKIMGLRLTADGVMGRQTRSAVSSFQQRRGLRADGVVGSQTERALIAAGASPPPGTSPKLGGAPSVMPTQSVPGLIKREDSPQSYTLYVEIDLDIVDKQNKKVARPITGIFIPERYKPGPKVDLMLYLHGFKHPNLTIDGYWNRQRFPYWPLREGVNESQKNVVLVAPTLGPRSQTGRLTRPGGFDAYLNQVMAALRAYGPYRGANQAFGLGNIILACHSGGGLPMRSLALGRDRNTPLIRECWGFDSTYNQGEDILWPQWVKSHSDTRVYIYYIPRTQTEALALSLKRKNIPNVFVERSTARGHNWVPIAHWKERLQGARFLAST